MSWQPQNINLTVTINFPALDALVAYLVSADQAKIDALTKQAIANAAKIKSAVEANTPPPPR